MNRFPHRGLCGDVVDGGLWRIWLRASRIPRPASGVWDRASGIRQRRSRTLATDSVSVTATDSVTDSDTVTATDSDPDSGVGDRGSGVRYPASGVGDQRSGTRERGSRTLPPIRFR